MKTSELNGDALDWAVAKCEGGWILDIASFIPHHSIGRMRFSTDWAQGGPIIERDGIALYLYGDGQWNAHTGGKEFNGPTPLIAAMRCYVASKLGDEVDVPEGICQ